MPPQTFTATVVHRRELAPDYFELTFAVDGMRQFVFTPGQFVTLRVPAIGTLPPTARAYSIASAPRGDTTFDLCIKLVHGTQADGTSFVGRGSGLLNDLQSGMRADFIGPSGVMPFDACGEHDWLLLGTGTGVAPVKAIAEHLVNVGCTRKIHFYLGVRHLSDVFYVAELQTLAARHSQFTFSIGISRPPEQGVSPYRAGRLPELLATDFPTGIHSDCAAYVCGGVAASQGIKATLLELGLPAASIHVEGYGE